MTGAIAAYTAYTDEGAPGGEAVITLGGAAVAVLSGGVRALATGDESE